MLSFEEELIIFNNESFLLLATEKKLKKTNTIAM